MLREEVELMWGKVFERKNMKNLYLLFDEKSYVRCKILNNIHSDIFNIFIANTSSIQLNELEPLSHQSKSAK